MSTLARMFSAFVIAGAIIALAAWANAATLKVCFTYPDAASAPDVAKMRLYAGTTAVVDDLLVACSPPCAISSAQSCSSVPFPPTVTRGTAIPYTLRAVNAFNEEGPASSPVSFRAPNVPGAPTTVSVGATVP